MNAIKEYFKNQFQLRMLFLQHDKPADFYLSCWQTNRSSVPLLAFRVLLFLTSIGIVISSITFYIIYGFMGYWFIYLTHWGITLNLLTTTFATVVSARCYFYGPITTGVNLDLPWYVKVYWILFNIATPLAFLITIFYWALLYNTSVETEMSHGLDLAVHALNSVVMFLLLMSASQPARLTHGYQPIVFTIVYVIFGVIYYLAGGLNPLGEPYIYPVLDWSKPGVAMLVVAMTGLLLVILYAFVVALSGFRDFLTSNLIHPSVTVHIDEGVPLRQQTRINDRAR